MLLLFFVLFSEGAVLRLSELAARCVAMHIPFEMVEKFQPPVPEELQQRITFWSFPEGDDDICLYTCLANSNDDEFLRGEILFENRNVYDVIQIGMFQVCGLEPFPVY